MTGKHKDKQEEVRPNKEDIIYSNLLYSCRISLEDTHEMEEIEECMTYVYPELLRKEAKLFAYDFDKNENYEEAKPSDKRKIESITWYVLMFLSAVFGISVAVLFTLAFLGVCK